MKKILIAIICITLLFSGCVQTDETAETLEKGDMFSVTGVVEYSDEPSDIGQEYCFITGQERIEYFYTDIYDEKSKYSSDVFYTRGNDTTFLKEYIGQEVTITGTFDAECHGIPYITDITVQDK